MTPLVLSIEQSAHYLGLSPSTIYRRIADRSLTAIKLGGRTVIRIADLEAMVANAPTK